MHPDGCGLPPSEHEVLYRRRATFETLIWSQLVVEAKVSASAGLQLTPPVTLVEIDVLKFHPAPLAFAQDVIATAAVRADPDVNSE